MLNVWGIHLPEEAEVETGQHRGQPQANKTAQLTAAALVQHQHVKPDQVQDRQILRKRGQLKDRPTNHKQRLPKGPPLLTDQDQIQITVREAM